MTQDLKCWQCSYLSGVGIALFDAALGALVKVPEVNRAAWDWHESFRLVGGTSARVGVGLSIMDSSMLVATMTGLPRFLHPCTMRLCQYGTCMHTIPSPPLPKPSQGSLWLPLFRRIYQGPLHHFVPTGAHFQ